MKGYCKTAAITILALLIATTAFAGPISGKLTADEIAKIKAGEVILKNDIKEGDKSGSGIAFGAF